MNFALITFSLVACTAENKSNEDSGEDSGTEVEVYNADPTAAIVSHENGETFTEAIEHLFVGQVSDANHTNEDLLVVWTSNTRELCAPSSPDASGNSECTAALEQDETQITLQVNDPEGAVATATIEITVQEDTPPTVELLSPQESSSYYADVPVPFSARISDTTDPAGDLSYAWTSDVDGDLSFPVMLDADGVISGELILSEGDHTIALQVEDSSGQMTTAEASITIGAANSLPLCEITLPAAGTYIIGETIEFAASVSDADINSEELGISWISDVDGELNSTAPDADGMLSFSSASLSAGAHTITLHATDEVGGACSDAVQVVVGTPPTLMFSSPVSGERFAPGDMISFLGSVEDQEDSPSDISISWVSDIDGVFSNYGAASNGNIAFGYSDLSAAEHNLTITATDTDGFTAVVTQTVLVNIPPPAPSVEFSPDPASIASDLNVSATSIDPDGHSVSYTYEWEKNGVVTLHTDAFIPVADLVLGDIWTVRVTPNDGYEDGDFTEASTTVLNGDPEITDIEILPATGVYNDGILTCSATVTDDVDTVTPVYEWTVGSNTYSGTSLDLSTTGAMPNDVVSCLVTATDSNGGSASASLSVTIENRAPVVGTAAIDLTTVYTNSTLTCGASASDEDGETVSLDYAWTVGSTTIGTAATIVLDNTLVSVGDALVCTASSTDGYGGVGGSIASVTIENTSPSLDTVSITPETAYNDDTLSCSATVTDPDEALTASYEWSLGGNVLASAASIDLSSHSVNPTDVLTCTASVTDGAGEGVSQTASITVGNRAPVLGAASIDNVSPYADSTLNCDAVVSDDDGESLSVSYDWQIGGVSVGSSATLALTPSLVSVGDSVLCIANVSDAYGEDASSSVSVTVLNTDPTMSAVSVTPSSVTTADTATCSATGSDLNDGSLSPVYAWSNDTTGAVLGSTASIELDSPTLSPNDVITCMATVTDNDGASVSDSASVTISNSEPTVSGTAISGGTYNTDVLTCSATVSDLDEAVVGTYDWSIASVSIGSGSSIDLATTAAMPGDDVVCTVSVADSHGGSASESATLTLLNRAPSAPTVQVSPLSPTELVDDLLCVIDAESIDPDGDSVAYRFSWSVGGVDYSGSTSTTTHSGDTIPASSTTGDEVWSCTVVPTDGSEDGLSDTASVTVRFGCAIGDCDEVLILGNGIGIDFVEISGTDLIDPLSRYTLANTFQIATTEVTQGMFYQVMGYDSHSVSTTYGVGDDYPTYYVNWHMAAHFANTVTEYVNAQKGTTMTPCYSCSGSAASNINCAPAINPYWCDAYRLPTEAEWEIAARAGTSESFWTGDGTNAGGSFSSNACDPSVTILDGVTDPLLGDYGWFCGNASTNYSPVAQKLPNGFGLYDTIGSVSEWTADQANCSFPQTAGAVCVSASGNRMRRGGSQDQEPYNVRVSSRDYEGMGSRQYTIGFRIVKSTP